MNAVRIDFQSADAARFNFLRDQWRSIALGLPLTRAGLRVAGVLPSFVNREFGYAFPTDDDLGEAIGADKKTAKRGLISLDELRLISRDTSIRRNEKGIVVGKQRRIYLTFPEVIETHTAPKGQSDDKPKGHSPKGHAAPKGQNRATEGTPGCPYILDSTPDYISAFETVKPLEGTYTRDVPSVRVDPSVGVAFEEKKAGPQIDPSVVPSAHASPPAQKPNSYLSAKNGDEDFARQEKKRDPVSSAENVPSVGWRRWKHPKILQGRPLSRKPFPAPRTEAAAHAFLRMHHVPESEWPKLLANLMEGQLYEFDIEPWMDVA